MRKSIRVSKLFGVLLTVLAIAILVKLGFWQLERATEKEQFFADYANRSQQTLELSQVDNPLEQLPRFTEVTLTGQFSADYLLLDNQVREGRVGYQVIGLMQQDGAHRVANNADVVMVNLGWVPMGASRDDRPQLSIPQQPMTIRGYFYVPEMHQVWGAGEHIVEHHTRPVRVQQLDHNVIGEALQLPIAPYVVLLSEDAQLGWPREWQPQVMTPEKHRAYAWQWFSLAAACLVVFWFASRSRKIKTEE